MFMRFVVGMQLNVYIQSTIFTQISKSALLVVSNKTYFIINIGF